MVVGGLSPGQIFSFYCSTLLRVVVGGLSQVKSSHSMVHVVIYTDIISNVGRGHMVQVIICNDVISTVRRAHIVHVVIYTDLKSTCDVNLLSKLSIIFKEWRVVNNMYKGGAKV